MPLGDPQIEPRLARRVRPKLAIGLAAIAALAYLCRNSVAVVEKQIRADTGLSEQAMGFLMGPAFFWSYALAQIPGGWAGQRWGSRWCLTWFAALSSLATIVFGLGTSYAALLAGRVAGGVAQAGLFPCATLSLARWFPRGERATASGALGAAMSVGGLLGAVVTAALLEDWGWRLLFVAYALPGLLWAAWFARWFRETPEEHPAVSDEERREIVEGRGPSGGEPRDSAKPRDAGHHEARLSWWELLAHRSLWLICGQQFFRAAGYAFFASWFATYLQETRGVSTAKSGWLLAIPLLTSAASALLGGRLSDWVLGRTGSLGTARCGLAAGSLLICACLVGSAVIVRDATSATLLIAAGAFFAGFAGPCAYAVTIDVGGRNVAPVFGAMNMVGNFGAGALPYVVPWFRKAVESQPMLLRWSGGQSWNSVLPLFAAMYGLAALCWVLLRVREGELDARLVDRFDRKTTGGES